MVAVTNADIPPERPVPRLHEPAPHFVARSTHGELALTDFRDRWIVLFSHPADFTPVCTTEFVTIAQLQDDFEALGVQLIGLSIDSVYAHIAWIRSIEQHFGVQVRFPVIADVDMRVSYAYGMLAPNADPYGVRGVFVIDPQGVVQAMLYYPTDVGRSMPEILRLVRALQVARGENVLCPANWQPGDPVLVSAPMTTDAAARPPKGVQTVDWYYATLPHR